MTSLRSPPPPSPTPRNWTIGAGGMGRGGGGGSVLGAGPLRKGAWLGVPAPLPTRAQALHSLLQPRGHWPGCGAAAVVDRGTRAVGVARGRGPTGGGAEGAVSVKAGAAAAAAGASGRCARLWGAGSAAAAPAVAAAAAAVEEAQPAAAAARLERPLRGGQLQRGRRSRDCALRGAGGDREQVIPAGTRSPTELAGRELALPGAAAAAPPRLVADGAGHRTRARASLCSWGPGKPLPLQAPKCLLPLAGARSAAEQSCGRVPLAEPRHCRDPAGPARSLSATDTPAPLPLRPQKVAPSGNCF